MTQGSLKPLFEMEKYCIQCGNRVQSNFVRLAHQNYIDQGCLALVQETVNNGQIDQDMILYYEHILSLVIKCEKCKNIIDGNNRKRNYQGNSGIFCHMCVPFKKQVQKAPQFCALCNKEMNNRDFKDMPIQVSGLVICHKCYSYQVRGMEETKEKQQKPDFGDYARKDVFKDVKKQPIKHQIKRVPEEKPYKKIVSFTNHEEPEQQRVKVPPLKLDKKHPQPAEYLKFIPKFSQNKNPFKQIQKNLKEDEIQFNFPAQDVFSYQISKKQKKEKIIQKKIDEKKKKQIQKQQTIKVNHNYEELWDLNAFFGQAKLVYKPKNNNLVEDKKQFKHQNKEPNVVDNPLINFNNTNYDLKGCKICLNAQSTMINNRCRHLMMCDICYRKMQSRQKVKNDTMPCPYCSTVGKYTRYIEPIYI